MSSDKNGTSHIRNIGIMAHIDAGKTTTTERILYYTGKIHRMGEVDEGSATMDWMDQEKERGITITSAVTTCFWRGHQINIIDTPGHVDFTIEVERSLRVLDGAVAVFCGVGGVEPQSETVWRQAVRYGVPRIAFVNKLDRIGSNFDFVLQSMRDKLKSNPCAITIPYGYADSLSGVIDVIEGKLYIYDQDSLGEKYEVLEIPDSELERYKAYHTQLVEMLAEHDDELLKLYLDGKPAPSDLIKRVLRTCTLNGEIIPVLAGSALRNIGVQKLIDAIVDYLPSPDDLPPIIGFNPKTGEPKKRELKASAPFSALVFKIATDPFVERLTYIRIYSGVIKVGRQVLNTRLNKKERIMKIFRMHANKREEIQEISAGEIVGVAGLKESRTGDTICDPDHPIAYEGLVSPEPVIYEAIEPKTQADFEKLNSVLEKLMDEDPTFKVRTDEETGQTLIYGMGELHLEVLVHRIIHEFGVDINVGYPQVAYREGITRAGWGKGEFKKQFGDKVAFAEIELMVEPGKGTEIIVDIQNSDLIPPKELVDAFREAALGVLSSGPLASYPLIDVKVKLTKLVFDPTFPSTIAVYACTSRAVTSALKEACPIILEPVMSIEILAPDEYLGDIINDLGQRRTNIEGIESKGGLQVIKALIPLSMSFGYSTTLRSLTQGRGTFTMQFHSYEPLPQNLETELLKKIKGFV